jgi:preprotein translocase subunit YajC
MMFALFQQTPSSGPPGWTQFVFIGGMALMFYFLLIRPQSKARKEMEARLSKLKAGDEVLTSSGFFATVDRVDEKDAKVIYLKLGSNVVKARRQAVSALASEPETEK